VSKHFHHHFITDVSQASLDRIASILAFSTASFRQSAKESTSLEELAADVHTKNELACDELKIGDKYRYTLMQLES